MSRVWDGVDWAEEWRSMGIPAAGVAIMKARRPSDRATAPKCFEDCHWDGGWASHRFWGLSHVATASSSEQAEWAAEEIAWQIRETVLSELEKRSPASRLLDQLCERPHGLGSGWGYR